MGEAGVSFPLRGTSGGSRLIDLLAHRAIRLTVAWAQGTVIVRGGQVRCGGFEGTEGRAGHPSTDDLGEPFSGSAPGPLSCHGFGDVRRERPRGIAGSILGFGRDGHHRGTSSPATSTRTTSIPAAS